MKENNINKDFTNFIKPIKLEIPFKSPYKQINLEEHQKLNKEKEIIINELFPSSDNMFKTELINELDLSLIPHNNGYTISYSPINLLNIIFKKLGFINIEFPFYNLDNKEELNLIKQKLNYNLKSILKIINNNNNKNYYKRILPIINDLINSIDKLFDIRYINHTNLLNKNLLFYLSYLSLYKLIETNNSIYSVLPKEYYKKLINNELEWPRTIYLNGKECWINTFEIEFEYYYKNNPKLFEDKKQFDLDYEIYIGTWEIIPKGKKEEIIKSKIQYFNSKKDYNKYIELFKRKSSFYESTNYNNILIGNKGLNGYFGFCYPNEYLVLDKFYNSINNRTTLTREEAIYSVPSDRLDITMMNKERIKQERKVDKRIIKTNHDPHYNWQSKINEIINSDNVSTSTFEKEFSSLEEKNLIYKRTY